MDSMLRESRGEALRARKFADSLAARFRAGDRWVTKEQLVEAEARAKRLEKTRDYLQVTLR